MKLVLYILILLGATLLGFDLAKEVKKIEQEPIPEPTQPVQPQDPTTDAPEDHSHAHADALKAIQQQVEDLSRKIGQSPEESDNYLKRAVLYAQIRQPEKALSDLNKAAELTPDNAEIYYQRGYIQIASAHAPQALADFSKALEINPAHTQARLYRAIIHYRQENFQFALDDCLDLLKHEPTFYDAHLTTSRCYFELNHKAKAIEHLETYIAHSKNPEGIREARRLIELWNQKPAENETPTPSTNNE
ncbi:MAG: tetratricopeptide repeat protein [Verrucomicrobiae bacterium]|nr:tetratricopeptide repeat protein [Verrucomicrobiae bacterium]NNJ43557.1 tetratricopeptide repeat protein [Akkermansiaceae bacterium]